MHVILRCYTNAVQSIFFALLVLNALSNTKNVCVQNRVWKCVWFWGQNVAGKLLRSSHHFCLLLWSGVSMATSQNDVQWMGYMRCASDYGEKQPGAAVSRRCKRKYVKCSNKTALHMFFWCGFSGRCRHARRNLTAAPKTLRICCPLQRENLTTCCDFPCTEKSLHDINALLCCLCTEVNRMIECGHGQ